MLSGKLHARRRPSVLALVLLLVCALPLSCHLLADEPEAGSVAAPVSDGSEVSTQTYPWEFVDARKVRVRILKPANRIVSLAPSLTETLLALGAAPKLVGCTDHCKAPGLSATIPRVGTLDAPNLEAILSLKTDLVVCSLITPKAAVDRLTALGITVVSLRQQSLDDVLNETSSLGKLSGFEAAANQLLATLEARIHSTRDQLLNVPKIKTLLLYDLENLFSAGRNSFPGKLVELCGGENLAAKASSDWPRLSLEFILREDPEVILFAQDPSKKDAYKNWETDPLLKNISAVKNHRVVPVPAQLLYIPGPRALEAIEVILKALHPSLSPE